jgi:hypothetical protein
MSKDDKCDSKDIIAVQSCDGCLDFHKCPSDFLCEKAKHWVENNE